MLCLKGTQHLRNDLPKTEIFLFYSEKIAGCATGHCHVHAVHRQCPVHESVTRDDVGGQRTRNHHPLFHFTVVCQTSASGAGGHKTLLYGHAVQLKHVMSEMYLACLSSCSSNDKLAFDVGVQETNAG